MKVSQLKASLIKMGVKESAYSLCDEIGNEQYCLENTGSQWFVFYSERGQRAGEQVFKNESEACEYFYERLSNDPTVIS